MVLIESYQECLQVLYNVHTIKNGLTNAKKVSELLGNPSDKYKTIHVAGTNGKGSTCYKIYSVLKMSRFKVGIFTSPHILSLRERIMVNDELISEDELVFLVNQILNKSEEAEVELTFFEIITLVAFQHFLNEQVEYAIIETGLGGKQDATNILKHPEVIVITSIGFDHMNILGPDLSSICNEKIGIFKKNANIVVGPSVSIYRNVFEKAKTLSCNLRIVPPEPRGETTNEENSRIALEVCKILSIKMDSLIESVLKIKLPLRLQYLAKEQIEYFKNLCLQDTNLVNSLNLPTIIEPDSISVHNPYAVILDISHNETAIDKLCRDINYFHKGTPITICVTITKPRGLDLLKPFIAHFRNTIKDIFYVSALNTRTYEVSEIIQMIQNGETIDVELKEVMLRSFKKMFHWLELSTSQENLQENAHLCKRGFVPTMVKKAFLDCCKDHSILLFTGSFFFFDEILDTLHIGTGYKDPVVLNGYTTT